MSKTKFLVKENANWADEFDCEGFKVISADSKEDLIESLIEGQGGSFPMSCCFGTNEELEFESREEFEEALDIKKISEEDLKILKKYFPDCERYAFGTTGIL